MAIKEAGYLRQIPPDTTYTVEVQWPRAGGGSLNKSQLKSDLRNHQAIVQPRLYYCLMVTQITLKTEGPHGLPSDRSPRSGGG